MEKDWNVFAKDMRLAFPIEGFDWKNNVSQLFGVAREFYSERFGIPGHNALDITSYYGSSILAAHDGVIEKVSYDVPHRSNGNGIYLMSSDGLYSTIYWHLSQFLVNVGERVVQGQKIALMGNSGLVRPIPTQDCPRCGTHVHFGVEIHGLNNEYGGFVDPVPRLYEGGKLPISFQRTLSLGSSGDDVAWLQTCLALEGFAHDYQPIGVYGLKTMRDVMKLQNKISLIPVGQVGPATRGYLAKYYQ